MNKQYLSNPKKIGRPKGSLNKRILFAKEWAHKLGMQDPCEFLIRVMNADTFEVTKADAEGNAILDAKGRPVKQLVVVPLQTRVQCAIELMVYSYPRLSQQSVATHNESVHASVDITKLIENPATARAAQELALQIATGGMLEDSEDDEEEENEQPALPAPDPAADFTRTGHWEK